MQEMITNQTSASATAPLTGAAAVDAAPLIQVLWRRRWTLGGCVLACMGLVVVYLLLATPVYRAASEVVIAQNPPTVFADGPAVAPSETFAETQRDILRSASVISRALQSIDYRKTRTFGDISGDVVAYLQAGNGFDVDTSTKSDVLVVSMESRYPQEAAAFVDAEVKAFISEQADHQRSTGTGMLKVLGKERTALQLKRESTLQEMVKSQQASGLMSYRPNEQGNIVVQRASSLSQACDEHAGWPSSS